VAVRHIEDIAIADPPADAVAELGASPLLELIRTSYTAADVPFEVPDRSEYPERLSTVQSVIYLIYNEGYSASFGQNWIRDELCTEALRLGRVLAALNVSGQANRTSPQQMVKRFLPPLRAAADRLSELMRRRS